MEKVVCAANYYNDNITYPNQPLNIKTGYVICGLRHNNCIAIFNLVNGNKSIPKEEGFLTTANRFVSRKEAAQIALSTKQITKLSYFKDELDSSDLY